MKYQGSCHCGKTQFSVEGALEQVIECNCSHCSRKGYLLWFVGRDELKVTSGEDQLATYLFNKHAIEHKFCPSCGCAPFGRGRGEFANKAAVNVRCLQDIDLKALQIVPVDGKSA
jgi:hypothetical protein